MFSIFSSNLLSIKDCAQPNLTMDGYCHDETNIPECNFDWGDCCGECVNIEFCTNCTCIGNSIGKKVTNPAIGDGVCNDYLNNKMCDFEWKRHHNNITMQDCPLNENHEKVINNITLTLIINYYLPLDIIPRKV